MRYQKDFPGYHVTIDDIACSVTLRSRWKYDYIYPADWTKYADRKEFHQKASKLITDHLSDKSMISVLKSGSSHKKQYRIYIGIQWVMSGEHFLIKVYPWHRNNIKHAQTDTAYPGEPGTVYLKDYHVDRMGTAKFSDPKLYKKHFENSSCDYVEKLPPRIDVQNNAVVHEAGHVFFRNIGDEYRCRYGIPWGTPEGEECVENKSLYIHDLQALMHSGMELRVRYYQSLTEDLNKVTPKLVFSEACLH